MTKELLILKDKFFSGIVRDEKSKTPGALSNCEELDIFSNGDYIQPEQVMSADAMPASTEIYAYTAGDDDTVYGYGKSTSAGEVRIVSVASGGATDPSTFSTLMTSSDTTNDASVVSDFKFFRSTESSNATSLYYIKGTSTTWYISRYNLGAAAEQRWTGSAWSAAGSLDSNAQLTGLDGSFMRPTMKVIFGSLYICHGRFIAEVENDGSFTEKAFTLPQDWEAVDIIPVGDKAIILCRNKNKLVNQSRAFWWDLAKLTTFEDHFSLPMGGPLWIVNHKETIKMACSQNGIFKIYQLTGPFQGALPVELPGITLSNIQSDATTQPISSPKMVSTKDNILYFGLYKTDKTGIYGLGQLDSDKPNALVLSKRFIPSGTSDYANHKPVALLIQGPNFYASYYNSSTSANSRCESNNSPTRSSDATFDTPWIDLGQPLRDKQLKAVLVNTKRLSASTSLSISIASDYNDSSFTTVTRANGSGHNTENSVFSRLVAKSFAGKKAFKIRCAFTSSTTSKVQLQNLALHLNMDDAISTQ